MLLCKCMNLKGECKNVHWADLTEDQKHQILHPKEAAAEAAKEDKSWPPSAMETK